MLKRYVREEPITRRFFNATPDSPIEDFILEASRHTVFRIAGADGIEWNKAGCERPLLSVVLNPSALSG